MTEEIRLMIKDCQKRCTKLTEWEQTFINNIYEYRKLSPKQIERLNIIWDRVTS